MSEYVDFHYLPLEGKITGKQVLKQTEDAINDLGNKVYNLDVDESRIDEAIENSEQAIDTANSALSAVTTARAVWKNTVAEMKATDIDLGVTAVTRGKMAFNDGSGAFYGVRSEKSGDVESDDTVFLDNGNVAERIQSMNVIAKGNNIIFVTNVAELIDSDALVGNVYGTAGYNSANDGGAGIYFIRTKAQSDVEDGGSIIFLANGNVAELITDGTVNVKQFGAKGNDINDDTPFIQNAMNALKSGDVLFFPNGTYVVTPTGTGYILSLPNVSDIEIRGQLYSAIKIAAVNQNYTGIIGVHCDKLYVHDITFDHNCENNTLSSADYTARGRYTISCYGIGIVTQGRFENINMYNCDSVVSLYFPKYLFGSSYVNADEFLVTNCKWINSQNGGNGLNYDQSYINVRSKNLTITNNMFVGKWSKAPRTAVEIHADSGICSDNLIDGFMVGVIVYSGEYFSVKGFIVANNTLNVCRNGVFLWPEIYTNTNTNMTFEDVLVSNNTFNMQCDKYPYNDTYQSFAAVRVYPSGSKLSGMKNITIADNTITYPLDSTQQYTDKTSNSYWAAIESRLGNGANKEGYNIAIKNNSIYNTPYMGIIFEYNQLKGLEISHNRLQNCCTYNSATTVSTTYKDAYIVIDCTLESDVLIEENVFENYIQNSNAKDYVMIKDRASTPSHYFIMANNHFDLDSTNIGDATIDYIGSASNNDLVHFSGDVPSATGPRLPTHYSTKGLFVFAGNKRYIKTGDNTWWNQVEYSSAIPSTGAHRPGDICYNTAPTAGGNVGWVCTTTGTPGTWKGFGAIEA